VSSPELSVVCKSCGSEVSPYVTECPYCGARLRKRAPKLQRQGEGLETRRGRWRRPRLGRSPLAALGMARPYATIAVIFGAAVMSIVQRATGDALYQLGGIAAPVGSDWWRFLTAPFVYANIGFLFVVSVELVLFGPGLERRLGTVATLILFIACGALGMVAANAINPVNGAFTQQIHIRPDLVGNLPFPVPYGISGGNGIALGALGAWFALRYSESRNAIDQDLDWIGVAVCAAVLLLLPAVVVEASVWAGLAGGLVGVAAGFAAAALRPAD
jgi:membrane associated rhomboid family serine protease